MIFLSSPAGKKARTALWILGAALATTSVSCRAADAPPDAATPTPNQKIVAPAPLDFSKSGQTWAFLGDSITHGGEYHQWIQLFLATRYPGRNFWTLNAGRSGDNARGAVGRVRFDLKEAAPNGVAPDVVFVHFGMNDVGRTGYTTKSAPNRESMTGRLETYAKTMEAVVEQTQKLGARVVIISPTIYDNEGGKDDAGRGAKPGLNEQLGVYGQTGQKLAQGNGFPFIDVHTPMTQLSAEHRAENPNWTLTRDRVHPNNDGQEVFAYYILKALEPQPYVYRVAIDAAKNKFEAQGATVLEHNATSQKVAFTLNESALPFPVAEKDGGLLKEVPFAAELNQQLLRVSGLEAGRYQLKIDGAIVAETDAKELAAGVNLLANPKTPQFQAALKVRALIFPEKRQLESNMRDLQVMIGIGTDKYNLQTDNETAFKELETWLTLPTNKSGGFSLQRELRDFSRLTLPPRAF